MTSPRSPDSRSSSPSQGEATLDGRLDRATDQEALRQLALEFQAAVRAVSLVALSPASPPEVFDALAQRVREYSAVARSHHIGPEQVLVRVKAATSTLTAGLPAPVADALGRVVMRALLAGYYGEVAGRASARAART